MCIRDRAQIVALLRNYFRTIIKNTTNLAKTVDTINHFDPDLHQAAFSLTDTSLMRDYLKCLFSGNTSLSSNFLKQAKPKYLTLLYEYNDTKSIEEWIRSIDLNSVDTGTTLKIIDEHQDFKMSVKFLIKLQDYDLALDKINQIISQLLRQDDPLLLNEFLDLGVQVSQKSEGTNQNWIKLISNLISQYSSLDNKGKVACDGCLQTLFIRLSELDISKSDEREDSFFWSTIMKIFENQTLISVSYTHLDVYKRQTLHSTNRCLLPIFNIKRLVFHVVGWSPNRTHSTISFQAIWSQSLPCL